MKIKDIVLREADVTLKPMPGAQEVDIDGKAVGTATTPAAATAISDLAKKGEFTPAGDEQQTSEDAPDQGTIDVMRSAITSAMTNSDLTPEQKQAAQSLIVKDSDGDVDADKTLINCLKALPAAVDELVTLFGKLVEIGEAYISGSHPYEPKFATLPPEDQAKYKQDINDLKTQLSRASQMSQQQKPAMDKALGDLQSTLAQATPQKPVQEELARIRKLSGQTEAQSIYPSRNDPELAQQAAQTQPGHQSVMPSRNKPQYTADEMTAILSGQKTQQQVDAEKAAGTKEGHQDLVSQGNHDVGGDATDRFINQVRDKGFEKANKHGGSVSRSPLSEKDELYKWLTIAGIK